MSIVKQTAEDFFNISFENTNYRKLASNVLLDGIVYGAVAKVLRNPMGFFGTFQTMAYAYAAGFVTAKIYHSLADSEENSDQTPRDTAQTAHRILQFVIGTMFLYRSWKVMSLLALAGLVVIAEAAKRPLFAPEKRTEPK